jgi:PDZ domain
MRIPFILTALCAAVSAETTPPVPTPQPEAPPTAEAATRTVTFLGVATVEASPELRKHLQLSEGFGLRVVQVTPDSAAAHAGLAVDDVLVRFQDQRLVNSQQLAALVRSHAPHTETNVSYYRAGTLHDRAMQLGTRTEPLAKDSEASWPPAAHGISPMPPEIQERIRQMFLAQSNRNIDVMPLTAGTHFGIAGRTTYSQVEGKQHMRVEDAEGKVIYEGPVDAPEAQPYRVQYRYHVLPPTTADLANTGNGLF